MLGDILRRINLFDEPPSLPITVNHLQGESVHAREVNRGSGSCAKHVSHIGALATLSLCPARSGRGTGAASADDCAQRLPDYISLVHTNDHFRVFKPRIPQAADFTGCCREV